MGLVHPVAILVREKQNHKGASAPWGEGMLGNYQQNNTKLILCIYSLYNIYQHLL